MRVRLSKCAAIDPSENILSPTNDDTEAEKLIIPRSLSLVERSYALLIVNFLHYQQRLAVVMYPISLSDEILSPPDMPKILFVTNVRTDVGAL